MPVVSSVFGQPRIEVLEADDIVLAEIGAGLNLDQVEGILTFQSPMTPTIACLLR